MFNEVAIQKINERLDVMNLVKKQLLQDSPSPHVGVQNEDSPCLEIVTLCVWSVICIAVYGAVTANKKIILTQGGPAILAILSILLFK